MSALPVAPVLSLKLSFENILVGTDFSPCSDRALKVAVALAKNYNSKVHVVNAIPAVPQIPTPMEASSWEYDRLKREAEQHLQEIGAGEQFAGIEHHTETVIGDPLKVLAFAAHNKDADLIVIGTHGRTGLKKLFVGSVAEEIVRLADCPVLTVGSEVAADVMQKGIFHSILYATDFSVGSERALAHAIALARRCGAKLRLLHVVEEASMAVLYMHEKIVEDCRKRLLNMVPAGVMLDPPIEIKIEVGGAADEILRHAISMKADLIVMGVHRSGETGARTSAHVPWTIEHMVVAHATCPVLTVRG